MRRAGTGPCGRERPPGTPGAAVHRHILHRMNAINDSLKKKKKKQPEIAAPAGIRQVFPGFSILHQAGTSEVGQGSAVGPGLRHHRPGAPEALAMDNRESGGQQV